MGVLDPARYSDFGDRVKRRITDLGDMLVRLVHAGSKIGAYGAPAKGNTLLNALEPRLLAITVIAENNRDKIGKVAPGSNIPIVSEEQFLAEGYDFAVLLAWN